MKNQRLALLVLFGSLAALQAVAQGTTHHHEWTYEGETGPAHWGDLKPEYATCSAGRKQSPIDIQDAKTAELPPIHFNYSAVPLKIINNGHTIQIIYASGSFISVGAKRYELKQFHFHHPSEEGIQGKSFDMVAHLVHADSEGKLAVVAVLLESGSSNKAIQGIWERLPKTEGEEQEIQGTSINAAGLLPDKAAYFTFTGSLTTPPCTEGVTWFVLQTPVQISPDQIDAFAKLFPHNARATQPVGDRVVLKNQ